VKSRWTTCLLLAAVVVVAGGTVAAAALPFPAALLGDPDHGQPKQDGQDQNGDNSANRHKKDLSLA